MPMKRMLCLLLTLLLMLQMAPAAVFASEVSPEETAPYTEPEIPETESFPEEILPPAETLEAVSATEAAPIIHTPSEPVASVIRYRLSMDEEAYAEYPFTFDPSWFFQDSTGYNHDLAKMSMHMAFSTFSTEESLSELHKLLGFEQECYAFCMPESDSIGYAIAAKPLLSEQGESCTLLAVTLRSRDYGPEWANNFTVDSGSEHAGFASSAATVTAAVKEYIQAHAISGNIRLWFSGYSRGAAVANIAAHRLNQEARSIQIPGLSEKGIFAYCFATPNAVRTDHYDYALTDRNIFNIVNPDDIVPMITPKKWNFRRYGTTYYLPGKELSYHAHSGALQNMRAEYASILLSYYNGDLQRAAQQAEVLTTSLPAQNRVFAGIVNALASFFSQSTYVSVLQNTLRDMWQEDMDLGGTLDSFVSGSFLPLNVLPAFATSETLPDAVTRAHYADIYAAWMNSLPGASAFVTESAAKTRYFIGNGSMDISVYDSQGNLAAQIRDGAVQENAGASLNAMIDENDQKVICLPLDEAFRMQITPTQNGTISCQIEEFDIHLEQSTRIINYYDIPCKQGESLTGTVEGGIFTLFVADSTAIAPTNTLTGNPVAQYQVNAVGDGNGTVTGGAYYNPGEYAKLVAQPKEGYLFGGWFANGQLLSMEPTAHIRVERSMFITAAFTENKTISLTRIAGDGRCQTAMEAAEELKKILGVSKFQTILVADGNNYPDALSGSYLAAVTNAPILLVQANQKKVTQTVKEYILGNLTADATVYILGGTNSIPTDFETSIANAGYTVKRLAGNDRYLTSLMIIQEGDALLAQQGKAPADSLLVCAGGGYADSLSASATGRPVLLVNGGKTSLTTSQKTYLDSIGKRNIFIIGGPNSVSDAIATQLNAYDTDGITKRIAGDGREETSAAVASEFFPNATFAVLADGNNYPDGLSGGPVAYAKSAPLLLIRAKRESFARDYVGDRIKNGYIMGGPNSVSEASARTVFGSQLIIAQP